MEQPKRDAENRKEARLIPPQPVRATVLNGGEQLSMDVLDMSGRGMSLRSAGPLPLGTTIQVETEETMLLGEVCNCRPDGDRYRLGVSIKHSLRNLAHLRAWNRALVRAGGPVPAECETNAWEHALIRMKR